jgi:hypothetical protein
MMAMLRRFMLLLLRSDNGWSAISPENRDPLFRIALKTWNLRASGAQKGSPAKRTGHTLLVAAQYIQKSPKNNGLVAPIWYPPVDLFGNIRSIGWVPRVSECQRSISGEL